MIPESERSPEEGIATHPSILAWRIPWTEEPGGLQFTGWQRVGHDSHTHTHTYSMKKKNEWIKVVHGN